MVLSFFCSFIIFFFLELFYIRIAKKYSIIDKPNFRSSHHIITVRGGGIIFSIAIFVGILYENPKPWLLTLSLLLIAGASFIDDIRHVDSRIRLILQSIAVGGMLYSFDSSFPLFMFLFLFIIITGVINAYNFMDGINGITVLYSLVTLCSIYWAQLSIPTFLSQSLFILLFSSLVVFAFFNLRKKAVCFSGDIGSVSLAFIFCFLLLKMALITNFGWWILFLGVYGIDTVFTIVCRLFRKEALLQAHRSHFYQYLANEARWGHVQVSFLYAFVQLIINLCIIYSYTNSQIWPAYAVLFVVLVIYTIFRFRLEGLKRLFVRYSLT